MIELSEWSNHQNDCLKLIPRAEKNISCEAHTNTLRRCEKHDLATRLDFISVIAVGIQFTGEHSECCVLSLRNRKKDILILFKNKVY